MPALALQDGAAAHKKAGRTAGIGSTRLDLRRAAPLKGVTPAGGAAPFEPDFSRGADISGVGSEYVPLKCFCRKQSPFWNRLEMFLLETKTD